MSEYKVQLEVFEGPLDLLLYLIKKSEVDIYNIPIATITTQYMEYLDLMKLVVPDVAGEFIVMGATLMYIKSRTLLPVEQQVVDPEAQGEEADPRWELIRQLVEYKKFKDAASQLGELEERQENIFARGAEGYIPEVETGLNLTDVSLFDLIAAFNEVLKKVKEETFGEIFDERYTVADKIELILKVTRDTGMVTFSTLFVSAASRHEIVCTFLALLELIRLKQLAVRQDRSFGDILVTRVDVK